MQQDTEDAGHAGAGGTQAHNAGVERTAGTARQTAQEGLKVAQVDAEDGRLSDAHEGRHGGGQCHGFDLLILALEGDGQGCTALGHVGGAGQRQPVCVAELGQLAEVNDRVHMVNAGHDGDGIQTAHDEGTDAEGQLDEGLHAVDDAVLNGGEDGADDGQRQIAGDENGNQRGDKQVKHGRHDLVQPLFNLRHDPDCNDDRDDVALVAHQWDGVQPAEHRLIGLHALGRDGPGVLQVGVDHDHADDRAQVRVAAEDFRGRIGNQDGQESVGGVGENLCKDVDRAGGIDAEEAVVDHEVQRFHDAHEEARRHDGRDDGHKDVTQGLDGPLVPRRFGGRSLLDFLFRCAGDVRQRGELVVDFVHGAGAEDDL